MNHRRGLEKTVVLALSLVLGVAHAAPEGAPDAGAPAVGERQPDARAAVVSEPAPAGRAQEPQVVASAQTATADSDTTDLDQTPPDEDRVPADRPPTREKAKSRLSGLAAMVARLAQQANLRGAGTWEAPRDMANPGERRIALRPPELSLLPEAPVDPALPAAGMLDERIVREISQRKTMFRMCYESARRRGVAVTRADVKWRLSPDGSVRDVMVEVEQDDQLARCIRVIASRPFPTAVAEEVAVTIPLLFVSER